MSSTSDVGLPILGSEGQSSNAKPRIAKSRMSRVRFTVLLVVQLILLVHIAQWLITGETIAPLEPSEAMETVKDGIITVGTILFAAALLSTAIFGRYFCGWGCHVLLLQDASAKLLNRFGLRPKPFRSRVLMLMPLALALYMFVWPLVYRFVVAPILQHETEWAGFSTQLTTTNFWATFPSWMVTIPFLLLCGFLIIYLLGMKGYCSYGCPYGGFFAPIQDIAPGAIRVNDDCEHCGHCTAVCTSNVRVHDEVRDYGMVIDPGCMKCMDCVSVCPNDALSFGFGKPAIMTAPRVDHAEAMKHKRAWDLSWPEEINFGVLALLVFLAVRGAYGLVPLLFASGLTAVVVFLCWNTWKCIRKKNVRLHNWQFKREGRLRGAGFSLVAGTAFVLALVAHTGFINANHALASYYDGKVLIPSEAVFSRDAMLPNDSVLEHARKAQKYYETISWLGDGGWALAWTLQPAIDNRIGWLLAVQRDLAGAEEHMRASANTYGLSPEKAAGIGRLLRLRSDSATTHEFYRNSLKELGANAAILDEYIAWLEFENRPWVAITFIRGELERAPEPVQQWLATKEPNASVVDAARTVLEANPAWLHAIRRLSLLLMNHGETNLDVNQGIALVKKTLEIEPNNPFAWRALALGYAKIEDAPKAVDALMTSVRLEPDEPLLRKQLIDLLRHTGRPQEAAAVESGELP